MLFNSYIFIFTFLPVTLAGFYWLAPRTLRWRVYWLTLASLFFYGWWSPPYLILLVASILFNYSAGHWIGQTRSRALLSIAIAFNLGIIGYYKYAFFLLTQFFEPSVLSQDFGFVTPLLPLGISFFTFQQIAYLVDRYQGKVIEHSLPEYALFVSFFPQLIAGPIVHQNEILPQLTRKKACVHSGMIAMGLACFILGLAKKTLLADPLGMVASPVFENTAGVGFSQSWAGALAYTLQLYFDFSGYSDMAIGLGLLFGIKIPLNFFSPYKALNIIDFWRRWHMTLSRFLRDYLYIPLGGSRKGPARRYINLMITMLLGGLWHGAGWTFILWGGLHGLYLCLNHAWHKTGLRLPRALAWAITFLAVVFAWVLFRAPDLQSAVNLWSAMIFGGSGLEKNAPALSDWALIACGLLIALTLPNIHQWLRGDWRGRDIPLVGRWRPTAVQGMALGGVLFICLLLIQFVQSEFLYFNF